MTLNKTAEAEQWFKKSLELQPDYEEARHQLGYLYLSQNKLKAATAEARRILSVSPESLEGLDLSVAILLKQGSLEKAGGLCQRMLEMSSMGSSHWPKVAAYRLGYVLWRKKRKKEGSRPPRCPCTL